MVGDVRQLIAGAGGSQYQQMEFTTKALKGDWNHLILELGRWLTVEVVE